jgi:hypothetical protein
MIFPGTSKMQVNDGIDCDCFSNWQDNAPVVNQQGYEAHFMTGSSLIFKKFCIFALLFADVA